MSKGKRLLVCWASISIGIILAGIIGLAWGGGPSGEACVHAIATSGLTLLLWEHFWADKAVGVEV